MEEEEHRMEEGILICYLIDLRIVKCKLNLNRKIKR